MVRDDEKIVVHLELSKKAAELLYALNRDALRRPSAPDQEAEVDTVETPETFAANGIAENLRAAFVGNHPGSPHLLFTEADFDELTDEIGCTVWDALN